MTNSYRFNYLARANLDTSYEHQVYVEIPTGATLTGTLANALLKLGSQMHKTLVCRGFYSVLSEISNSLTKYFRKPSNSN